MSAHLSNRVNRVQPSATMAVNARATELRAEGHDIINLSVGEPDFDTPDFIKAAGIAAINEGATKYTAADGIPELKQAIIDKFKRDNQLDYTAKQIIATSGAKQGLYNLTQALLSPGDEAIIPAPYWVSYPAMVLLAEAEPVYVETHLAQQFKITAEQLAKAITPQTRLVFLNSPSNPTGMAYTFDELKALGEVLIKHPNIIVATDDIYEYILWGQPKFTTLLNACPKLFDQTVVFNGCSKAHAMTGWRLGYAAGPEPVIGAMKKIQSQSTSCPCSITQKAAVAALNAGHEFFSEYLNLFKRRHDLVYSGLSKLDKLQLIETDGTFYLFPDASAAIASLGLADDLKLAEYLLEKAHVAVVPGTAFGAPGYFRVSCATSDETLADAVQRISKALG